jgi:preprotein translocase subunit SecE
VNIKTENKTLKFNALKWAIVIALLVVSIFANSYFADLFVALRLGCWMVVLGAALLISFRTIQGQLVWGFLRDARIELRKVVWPTRQETVQTTLIIIGMVGVTALFLWGVDSALLWLVGFLTGQRG